MAMVLSFIQESEIVRVCCNKQGRGCMPVTPKASSRVRWEVPVKLEKRGSLPLVLSSICDGSWVVSYGNPRAASCQAGSSRKSRSVPEVLYVVSMFGRGRRGQRSDGATCEALGCQGAEQEGGVVMLGDFWTLLPAHLSRRRRCHGKFPK